MSENNKPERLRKTRSKLNRLGNKPRSRKGFQGHKSTVLDFNIIRNEKNNDTTNSATPQDPSTPNTTAALSSTAAAAGNTTPVNGQSSNTPNHNPESQISFANKIAQKLSQGKTKVLYRSMENKSSEKLKQSSLNKRKRVLRTRAQTLRHGIRKLYQRKPAAGFKLIDANILTKAFNNFSVCKSCHASSKY